MYSKTLDIIPFATPFGGKILSQKEVETLKSGTLHLLENVGVKFPSRKALEIFADHGAQVDMDTEIVRLPPSLVKKAMSTAPRSITLGGREERFDLVLDGTQSYLCTDGCGVHVIDLKTRQQRASRKSDVELMARVCDSLPLISFFWPLVSAQDHGITAPLHECHAGLTNTLKHVRGGTTVAPQLAPYIVEMATTVAGTEKQRRLHPPICANICTIAPLAQDEAGIETALVYAEAGIPTSFMAMPTMGSTAPATPLGALVIGDAEVVSAMVLMQLAYPGTPVFHSIYTSLMHPRTGGYTSSSAPVSMIATQLAHDAWNVPCLGGSGVDTDATKIGWSSGSAGGMGAGTMPLYNAEICGYLGLLGSAMILQHEQLILGYELCREVYDMLHGFDFDPQDMALDVIEDIGPGGHFLREKHTRKHIRDFHLPPIYNTMDEKGGFCDPQDVALEEFKRIAETHHPEPLADEVLAELDRILAAADREAEKLA